MKLRRPYGFRFVVNEQVQDSLVTFAWGTVAVSRLELDVSVDSLAGRLAVRSYYRRPPGMLGIYSIPGETALVTVIRYCGIPHEGGYTVDQPLLLLPRRRF